MNLSPWLVTRDEVIDPHSLALELTVKGEARQISNTSEMIVSVPKMVLCCSQFMTLLPAM